MKRLTSQVERTLQTDYLGVCIDDKLTFKCHISKMLRKVYFIVSSLAYTVLSFFSKHAKEHVFNSYILLHITFAVPVWYHFISTGDKTRILTD